MKFDFQIHNEYLFQHNMSELSHGTYLTPNFIYRLSEMQTELGAVLSLRRHHSRFTDFPFWRQRKPRPRTVRALTGCEVTPGASCARTPVTARMASVECWRKAVGAIVVPILQVHKWRLGETEEPPRAAGGRAGAGAQAAPLPTRALHSGPLLVGENVLRAHREGDRCNQRLCRLLGAT